MIMFVSPKKLKRIKMSKQKTKSSAKKRFKVTGSGKLKENMLSKIIFLQKNQKRES